MKNTNAFWLGCLVGTLFLIYFMLGNINKAIWKEIETVERTNRLLRMEIASLKTHPISPWDEMQTHKPCWRGVASYYSEDGCVGCREDRLMANGERFDETAMTLAFNMLPMNTKVVVKNLANDKEITATVTDTGGFGALSRIADLSKGLKDALGCTDLCYVEINEAAQIR